MVGTGLGGVDGLGGSGVVWAKRAPVNATREASNRERKIFIELIES
jgi:hypothetical protein